MNLYLNLLSAEKQLANTLISVYFIILCTHSSLYIYNIIFGLYTVSARTYYSLWKSLQYHVRTLFYFFVVNIIHIIMYTNIQYIFFFIIIAATWLLCTDYLHINACPYRIQVFFPLYKLIFNISYINGWNIRNQFAVLIVV